MLRRTVKRPILVDAAELSVRPVGQSGGDYTGASQLKFPSRNGL